MNLPQDLQVGDILLYSSKDIIDDLIKWKEDGTVAHIEVYAGNGTSWASRNGVGCGQTTWPFRLEGLAVVRRPVQFFDGAKAEQSFETKLKGQPYGFGDIEANIGLPDNGKGVDCSHAAAILCEDAGAPQFDSSYPKSKITPEHFQMVRESVVIYKSE